jgi:hypothetical protein
MYVLTALGSILSGRLVLLRGLGRQMDLSFVSNHALFFAHGDRHCGTLGMELFSYFAFRTESIIMLWYYSML